MSDDGHVSRFFRMVEDNRRMTYSKMYTEKLHELEPSRKSPKAAGLINNANY